MSHAFHVQKRKEKFYKLAKERGYRSRAAFKLIQLNKKYNFLGSAKACLDLCAAPGGWLQVCAENMPVGSLIIGVDLLPIRPIPGVITFVDDILTQSCRQKIRKQLNQWQVDLVLHDGAPNIGGGGTWARDAYQQCELVLHALRLATEFLVEGGTFVTKIFRSQDFIALCWVLRQFFQKVDVTKPTASRMASAEIFAVCKGYLAPRRIDARLFDPGVVFKQAPVQTKVPSIMKLGVTTKPNREGYETDKQVLFERASLSEFFESDNPAAILGRVNELYWDEDTEALKNSPLTKPEIQYLIQDLKSLGRSDFAILVRWHKKVRDFRKEERRRQQELLAEAARREHFGEGEEAEERDRRVLTEEERDNALLELQAIEDAKRRAERKKRFEKKQKQLRRMAQNINNQDMSLDNFGDDYFSIASAHTGADLEELGEDLTEEQFERYVEKGTLSSSESELETDDELNPSKIVDRSTYMKLTEESIDRYFAEYNKMRKNNVILEKKTTMGLTSEPTPLRGVAPVNVNGEDDDDEGQGQEEEDDDRDYIKALQQRALAAKARAPGISGVRDAEDVTATHWFGQDAFEDVDLDLTTPGLEAIKKKKQVKKGGAAVSDVPEIGTKRKQSSLKLESDDEDDGDQGEGEDQDEGDDDDDEEEDEEEEEEEEEDVEDEDEDTERKATGKKSFDRPYEEDDETDTDNDSDVEFSKNRWKAVDAEGRSATTEKMARRLIKENERVDKKNKGKAPEEPAVPEKSELDDISDDEHAQAEILAIATKMIRRKERNAIIDAAYNRYAWNDQKDLPSWFVEDENQFNRAQLPVTKAEVNAVLEHLKAVNARPIKKLAEAKARKKMKMMRKLDRLKIQADAIINQDNVSAEEKIKAIDKLYSLTRAKTKLKPQRAYVVTSKSGITRPAKSKTKGKGKTITVQVDSRMKKDKRAEKIRNKKMEKARKLRNKKRVKRSAE